MLKFYSCLDVHDYYMYLRHFAKLVFFFFFFSNLFNAELFGASLCCTAENTRDKPISIKSRIILMIIGHA